MNGLTREFGDNHTVRESDCEAGRDAGNNTRGHTAKGPARQPAGFPGNFLFSKGQTAKAVAIARSAPIMICQCATVFVMFDSKTIIEQSRLVGHKMMVERVWRPISRGNFWRAMAQRRDPREEHRCRVAQAPRHRRLSAAQGG
jgi:hypothetical protein